MVAIKVEYLGELRCVAVHGPSGSRIQTDAPIDNHGKGELFSPTDLLATSLMTCIATIMGIYAQQYNLDITGMRIEGRKEMSADIPRRISCVSFDCWMPKPYGPKERAIIESAIENCPVKQSLAQAVKVEARMHWPTAGLVDHA